MTYVGISSAVWVSAALILYAVVLLPNPLPLKRPACPASPVVDWVTDTTPVREPRPAPSYEVAVFTYRCNDCHRIIPPPRDDSRTVIQHREIDLQPGINTRCLNCYHPSNRNAFVHVCEDDGLDLGASTPSFRHRPTPMYPWNPT